MLCRSMSVRLYTAEALPGTNLNPDKAGKMTTNAMRATSGGFHIVASCLHYLTEDLDQKVLNRHRKGVHCGSLVFLRDLIGPG